MMVKGGGTLCIVSLRFCSIIDCGFSLSTELKHCCFPKMKMAIERFVPWDMREMGGEK